MTTLAEVNNAFKMTTTSILTTVIVTAVLSQTAMLSAEDSKDLQAGDCKELNIFNPNENYSVEEGVVPDCLKTPVWAQNVLHYFEHYKHKTDNKNNSREIKKEKKHLRFGINQLLKTMMYSFIELPRSHELNWTKLSTDIINAFHIFPQPTDRKYSGLACLLNEEWKIKTEKQQEQIMYIIDCILRSNALSFILCDKI
ncbi:uncharacterized protein LOC117112029 [Anneissia japonica]|uniref:uncharacterized protein LOC117112029 n=1 Tax=Anneissia japonica TaxID=1529436 RepID=UPI0014256F97|nr:uncharacterized protein LOC117112029 [Anneissia japonica]